MACQCLVDGCERDAISRGRCAKHYQQWRTGPDFERRVTPTAGRCSVDGCGNVEKSGGLCNTHYQRRRRERLRVPCPGRKVHSYSYSGRCVHCGHQTTRKYVPDRRSGWHKAKIDGEV